MSGRTTSRVVKVGGSLLTLPTLVAELRRWTASQAPATTLFLPGGGTLVDTVAAQQRSLGFDDLSAHWLCIRAMQVHCEMLSALMPECGRVASFESATLDTLPEASGMNWIDPWALMQYDMARAKQVLGVDPLPADWSVSSDSIAARAATFLGSQELVLLKSTLATAGEADYVDSYFATAARGIASIHFVNLRDPQFSERPYRS